MAGLVHGQIRVGRVTYTAKGEVVIPSYPNFTPIVVLTKSSEYGSLGPYELKNDKGQLMENIWQFSKVYQAVPEVSIPYTVRYPKIIWRWGSENHIDNDEPNEAYWHWRETGMNNPFPVRYPVGPKNMSKCLYALRDRGGDKLNYIESRKQIYIPVYIDLVRKQAQYNHLKQLHQAGENLLIIEVDGPHQETSKYYQETYGVGDNFITMNTMLATPTNLRIMCNDETHAFGHGYCLAMALLDLDTNF